MRFEVVVAQRQMPTGPFDVNEPVGRIVEVIGTALRQRRTPTNF